MTLFEQPNGKKDGKNQSSDLNTGLTSAEVKARLDKFGYNEVPEKRKSRLRRLASKFWGLTPVMLELTVVLTWILGNYLDSYIILALLLFNAFVSYFQESKANASIDLLRNRLKVVVRVNRDNVWTSVPSREIVPDDVIRLRSGDFASADAVIMEGSIEADQSSLTGESLTLEKGVRDLIYSGSVIRRGEATCKVANTGARTFFGRTVELVQIARPRLHLEDVVSKLVRWLIAIVCLLIAASLVIGLFRGQDLLDIVPLATILLVAAIPIALPTMFNITMALGSHELANKGIIVTRLSASEDAATMDVLCVDKTGTLTQNKLSVASVVPFDGHTEADVLLFGALASQKANSDPIDMAIISAVEERNQSVQGYTQEKFVPFSASTRRTEAQIRHGTETFTVVKGALGSILPLTHGTDAEVKKIDEVAETLSVKGYKTLAVARSIEGKKEFIGLVALHDRSRPETPGMIKELTALGISIKMLTGDSMPIARETAKSVGLGDRVERAIILKNKPDRARKIEATDVFAEVYPEDKYLIVKALQESGHIVGMTGDGVNDAPALKQAEVGIAVTNATDVAKKAASVVLSECGLEGIMLLVKTGRVVYQRILTWILNKVVKTFQVVVFVILVYLWSGQYVVTVSSMVLFLFLTDFVTLSLSTDSVTYSQTPDNWKLKGLLRGSALLGLLLVAESAILLMLGGWFFGLYDNIEKMRTFVFSLLVIFSVFDVLILRERKRFWTSMPSKPLLVSVIADVAIVGIITLLGFPGMASISLASLLFIIAFTAIMSFIINDIVKIRVLRDLGG